MHYGKSFKLEWLASKLDKKTIYSHATSFQMVLSKLLAYIICIYQVNFHSYKGY